MHQSFSILRSIGLSILIAFAFAAGGTHAHSALEGPEAAITADDIKHMEIDALYVLVNSFNPIVEMVAAIWSRPSNSGIDLRPILQLRGFPIIESLRTAYALLRSELRKADTKGPVPMNAGVVFAAIDVINAVGTSMPDNNLAELKDLLDEAKGRLKVNDKSSERILARLAESVKVVAERKFPLIDLHAHIARREAELTKGTSRLPKVQAMLERKIIGQPEVVQAIMDLEWRAELYSGKRDKPDAIYLMGLPGTGKDTTAEALADALHGFDGAHKNHLFRLPLMKNKADTWQVLGSATGYIGSESFPPFLSFLVQHSGGKYKIESKENNRDEKTYFIVNNPEYKGETLPGYYDPRTAVVFVNEFHNWSKQLKDDFIKQALEKGYFSINNPNGGLAEIFVPVRFVIASNEGIRLVTSREANGQRHGKAMSYEQILGKWNKVQDNKPALRNEILATNGSRNVSVNGEGTPGISEELLSRIPDRFIMLMRPLSPDDLRRIVTLGLEAKASELQSGMLGQVQLSWSQDLVAAIQEYDYQPEENARPVLARIGNFIEDPIIDAIRGGDLKASAGKTEVHLDIKTNDDRTRSLIIHVRPAGKPEYTVEQPIRSTEKDRPAPPISDERIDLLANLEQELKTAVFGIDPILERLAQRIVSIENETAGRTTRPANLIMLTGLSSTGKTETAKQLSRKVNGTDDDLVTFDFSQIQTLHDFQTKILGLKDAAGNPIPSEFMKQYDRSNGRLIVAFDELANVRDRDLLKSLYDFFREPVVGTFSDGKPRPMGGVTVIITGNAGQELYNQVPSHLPMEVQMKAWAEIYKRTNGDFELQRKILEKYYPEPLITRIGRNNIFFVPPHSYTSLRQLAQLKLENALDRIANTDSRRGWEIVFPTAEEYKTLVDHVIDEGFSLRYQGASIDSFIRDDIEEPLKYMLLRFKVPSGTRVALKYRNKTGNDDEEKPGYVFYDVFTEGRKDPIELKIRRPFVAKPLERDETDQIATAYHEAAHSLVRHVLHEDAFEPHAISIIPGVTMIAEEWVYYAGIAKYSQSKELSTTRDWVIREIAVLAAGETAERLITRGEAHSAGKQNDMARATRLARNAIIRYGLSERWGTHAVPGGMSDEAYVTGLSDRNRELLESEVELLVRQGRELAKDVLEANFNNALVPLATRLAEAGTLDKDALASFYKSTTLVHPQDRGAFARAKDVWRTRLRKFTSPRRSKSVNVELDASIPYPTKMADLDQIAAAEKRAQYDAVALPDRLPLGTNAAYDAAYGHLHPSSCSSFLRAAM